MDLPFIPVGFLRLRFQEPRPNFQDFKFGTIDTPLNVLYKITYVCTLTSTILIISILKNVCYIMICDMPLLSLKEYKQVDSKCVYNYFKTSFRAAQLVGSKKFWDSASPGR